MQIYYCMRRKEKRTFTVYRLSYWLLVLFVYVCVVKLDSSVRDGLRSKESKRGRGRLQQRKIPRQCRGKGRKPKKAQPIGTVWRCSHKERMRAIEVLEREYAWAEPIRGARAVRWKRSTNAIDVLRWNTQVRSSCLSIRVLWSGESSSYVNMAFESSSHAKGVGEFVFSASSMA